MGDVAACALCGKVTQLLESHIVSKFILDMMRQATGKLRTAEAPNRAVQDGLKRKMLCADCEARFSKWERSCAEFVRSCNADEGPFAYGADFSWLLLSLVWRTLRNELDDGAGSAWPPSVRKAAGEVEKEWRIGLLSGRFPSHAGELHALVIGSSATPSASMVRQLPPNWNRYLDTAVDATVATSVDPRTPTSAASGFSYVKMGRLVALGIIKSTSLRRWKGTKVHRRGSLNDGNLSIPEFVLRFMADRAGEINARMVTLSPRQRQKIGERVLAQPDDEKLRRTMQAIRRDVEMFGSDAVFGEISVGD